jgi:hypothetical protein
MTPTPTLILLVALFWTLPASAAVLAYRKHESSIEKAKTSVHSAIENAFGQTVQADA